MVGVDRENLTKEEENRVREIYIGLLKRKKFDLKDFFPDFKLEEPYGLAGGKLIHAAAQLYRHVIVPVEVEPSKTTFRRVYGLSITEFAKLSAEGRIMPLALAPYEYYPPWYDELFNQVYVPRGSRVHGFFSVIERVDEGRREEILIELWRALREKFKKAQFEKWILDQYKMHKDPKDVALNATASALADLTLFVSKGLCDEILSVGDPSFAWVVSHEYATFLVTPLNWGIGGYLSYNERDLKLSDDVVQLGLSSRKPEAKRVSLLLASLPWKFSRGVDLHVPRRVGDSVRYFDVVEKASDREDVLKRLSDIERSVHKGEFREANRCLAYVEQKAKVMSEEALYRYHEKPRRLLSQHIDFGLTVATSAALATMGRLIEAGLIGAVLHYWKKVTYRDEFETLFNVASKFLTRKLLAKKLKVLPAAYSSILFSPKSRSKDV